MYTETRIHIIPTLALEPRWSKYKSPFRFSQWILSGYTAVALELPKKNPKFYPGKKNISTQNSECISNIVGMMQKASRASSKIKCKLWVYRAIALSFFACIFPKVEGIAT